MRISLIALRTAASLGAATLFALSSAANAADPERMRADCRTRAANTFGVPAGSVEVKYEGERVDKTHAVNGSAHVRGHTSTFQCSFAPGGTHIAQFIVNEPVAGAAPGASGSPSHHSFKLEASERAYCRLINLHYGKDLYSGNCIVTETVSGSRQRYTVKMGGAQPVVFVRTGPGMYKMVRHGSTVEEDIRFADRGSTGVFRWDEFRLEIHEF